MKTRREMAEAWVAMAEGLGLSALPLCPPLACHHGTMKPYHRDHCKDWGKRPPYAWKVWQQRPMTRAEFKGVLSRFFPPASPFNLGVVTGPASGLVGIDADSQAAVECLYARLPEAALDTASYQTARGPRFLFRTPPGVALASVAPGIIGPGLEFLATGRQMVVPPSTHPSGVVYRWHKGYGPANWLKKAIELPQEVLALVRVKGIAGRSTRGELSPGGLVFREGSSSPRNANLFSMARALHWRGAGRDVIRGCLDHINVQCEPPLEDDELDRIADSACRYTRSTP